jgi:FkbM family methyltransferase
LVVPPDVSIEVRDCRYGKFLIFSADEVISRSLRLYGEWAQHELSVLHPYVVPGTVVADVGANIGTHTLAFSRWVGGGEVVACEAQELVADVLRMNCLLNQRTNVQVIEAVCATRGSRVTDARLDPKNMGAARFKIGGHGVGGMLSRLRGLVRQSPLPEVVALDDIVGGRTVSLIKIDAEGMERDVLRGAEATLRRSAPTLYFEQNDTTSLDAIFRLLDGLGYRLYWLETHPFNQSNFRSENDNVWWRTETGILAIHGAKLQRTDLIKVNPEDKFPPVRLDARKGVRVPDIPD